MNHKHIYTSTTVGKRSSSGSALTFKICHIYESNHEMLIRNGVCDKTNPNRRILIEMRIFIHLILIAGIKTELWSSVFLCPIQVQMLSDTHKYLSKLRNAIIRSEPFCIGD